MTAPERWLPLPGYQGIYEVSDQGRVRSLDRLDSLGRRRHGRILAAPPSSDGYRHLRLYRDATGVTRKVHQLVAEVFIGPQEPGIEVRHLDGDQLNNHVSNLAYGTHSDNMQDKFLHGTNYQANRTHCPHGHPYDQSNTYYDHRGWRQCVECRHRRSKNRRAPSLTAT